MQHKIGQSLSDSIVEGSASNECTLLLCTYLCDSHVQYTRATCHLFASETTLIYYTKLDMRAPPLR